MAQAGANAQLNLAQILVTVPMSSEVEFSQLGRNMRCAPGQFLLEYSDEPYDFSHGNDNLLWVLKLPERALQARVGELEAANPPPSAPALPR